MFLPVAIADCPSQESNLFLCFASCELLAFFALDCFIPGQLSGGDQGDGEAEQGPGQDIRPVMAVISDPGEGGDRGHDDQPQLEPDPGQEAAHTQSVLQINLTCGRED